VQERQVPLDVFVGRAAELARVAEVVTRVQGGQSWLVAVEGDPGMGKTSLARLGNIYAKCGLHGRQQLRRYVEQWHQPAAI
jgi:hypothetical protein